MKFNSLAFVAGGVAWTIALSALVLWFLASLGVAPQGTQDVVAGVEEKVDAVPVSVGLIDHTQRLPVDPLRLRQLVSAAREGREALAESDLSTLAEVGGALGDIGDAALFTLLRTLADAAIPEGAVQRDGAEMSPTRLEFALLNAAAGYRQARASAVAAEAALVGAALAAGQFDEALAASQGLLAHSLRDPAADPARTSPVLRLHGELLLAMLRHDEALQLFERAAQHAERDGLGGLAASYRWRAANALHVRALLHDEAWAFDGAGERYRALIEQWPSGWAPDEGAAVAHQAGVLLAWRGDLGGAQPLLRTALAGRSRSGAPEALAETRFMLGAVLRSAAVEGAGGVHGEQAVAYLDEAVGLLRAAGEHTARAQAPLRWLAVHGELARALSSAGAMSDGADADGAIARLDEGIALYRELLAEPALLRRTVDWGDAQRALGMALLARAGLMQRRQACDSCLVEALPEALASLESALQAYKLGGAGAQRMDSLRQLIEALHAPQQPGIAGAAGRG